MKSLMIDACVPCEIDQESQVDILYSGNSGIDPGEGGDRLCIFGRHGALQIILLLLLL